MTITTKKTSNGATIYYADGKRVAKAVAIKTAKENNINIIDTTTVDTNDNAGAKVSYDETNKVQDYAEAIEILKQVIDLNTLEYTPDKFSRFHNSYTAIRRSDGATVIVHEEMDYGIVWLINVLPEDCKDVSIYIKDAHAAAKAAEDAEPPYAPANRPVQTYATKYVHSVLCYFDKATGKEITEAKAFRATIKNAFKQVTATFKQYGKITESDAQDSTVTVSVDSYEKAIDTLNGVAKVFTGKAPFEWKTSKDIDGIYHVVQDGDLHEIKIYEKVNSVGNLSIDIRWISYNGEEPETDAIYTIKVAPVPNAPEPNDNGGNDKDNGNDSDKGNDSDNNNTVETAKPIISANRPVQTYYMKYVDGTFYYFDKKTGKQISEERAFKDTVKNAFNRVKAVFKRHGEIIEYGPKHFTVVVKVDSYQKAVGTLNGVAKVFTGRAPFQWSTVKDTDSTSDSKFIHVVQDGDHEIIIDEWVKADGNLLVSISWINYDCEKPSVEGTYEILVAPESNDNAEDNDNDNTVETKDTNTVNTEPEVNTINTEPEVNTKAINRTDEIANFIRPLACEFDINDENEITARIESIDTALDIFNFVIGSDKKFYTREWDGLTSLRHSLWGAREHVEYTENIGEYLGEKLLGVDILFEASAVGYMATVANVHLIIVLAKAVDAQALAIKKAADAQARQLIIAVPLTRRGGYRRKTNA